MIIAKLMGGLGNQMFQYAAARRLAWRHNAVLKLDISFLEGEQIRSTHREYALKHLNVRAEIVNKDEMNEVLGFGRNPLHKTLFKLGRMIGVKTRAFNILKECHFHFDPDVLLAPDDTYMEGYWQSERYFKDIKEIILEELAVKHPIEGKNLELAEMIGSTNSVSLHIRRGDFVTNPETSRVHGVCSLEYYLESIKEISKKVTDPYFFIFSDDLNWVKENLKIDYPVTYVDFNEPDNAYEDMRLMSLCRHNIIANSSFSWWGAWLNSNPDKLVFVPKKWFNQFEADASDLIPVNWIRV